MLGLYLCLFVIYEVGYGYEFFIEEMYQLYEVVKFYNKLCIKNVESYIIFDEEVVFYIFVIVEGKK